MPVYVRVVREAVWKAVNTSHGAEKQTLTETETKKMSYVTPVQNPTVPGVYGRDSRGRCSRENSARSFVPDNSVVFRMPDRLLSVFICRSSPQRTLFLHRLYYPESTG